MDEIPSIEITEDETPLFVFLATTRGVHITPFDVLGRLSLADQINLARDVAAQLRDLADQMEARAGLAEAVDDVWEAMP